MQTEHGDIESRVKSLWRLCKTARHMHSQCGDSASVLLSVLTCTNVCTRCSVSRAVIERERHGG